MLPKSSSFKITLVCQKEHTLDIDLRTTELKAPLRKCLLLFFFSHKCLEHNMSFINIVE